LVLRPNRVSRLLPLILVVIAGAALAAAPLISISFEDHEPGTVPYGFFFAPSRQATPGVWEVRGSARRHLIHLADPSVTMRGISIAGVDTAAPANVRIGTRLRLIDGDLAGGVFWRYRDPNNFYFMSIFHAERAARLVRVTGGNRIRLDAADNIDLDPNAWHTIAVEHDGADILATIDGIGVLRARDQTLNEGGRSGVWSAGNSTSWFDDITIEPAAD
jgi:hypothetical protein